ncbi:nocturnin [Aplochiton taeniatus]
MVCPTGGGATRLYSTPTKPLSSSTSGVPLSCPALDPNQAYSKPREEEENEEVQEPLDLVGLLKECGEALRNRPVRFRRKMVCQNQANSAPTRTFRVMQWNILAQALGEGMDSFVRCPIDALSWAERKYLLLEEILTYRPHILCLQEVDHYYDTFQPILAGLGYHGNFCPKPWSLCLDVEGNNGPDGCAIFFDQSRFSFQDSVSVCLSAMLMPTNQVAVVTTLRCLATGQPLYVATTHLKARSGWERLRSAQGSDLLRHLQDLPTQSPGGEQQDSGGLLAGVPSAHGHGDTPLLVCGDFNASPAEDVYRRFATSPLGLDSAYKKLSRDGQTEPEYTTWKIRSTGESRGTLDYVWYSKEGFRVEGVLELPTEEQIGPNRLPSYTYPSDHLSLVCDFSFSREGEEKMRSEGNGEG